MEPGKPTECPVVHAWSQSEFVLKRLLEKNLLILNGSRLSRGTVIANQELLIPLINLVGSSEASSSMYVSRGCHIPSVQLQANQIRSSPICRLGCDVLAKALCRISSHAQANPGWYFD